MRERDEIVTRGEEAGFALILAILALMLLTFLGLTLALTTSTELQIATNYRWSQQAYYNAEAGMEVAKKLLQTVPNWGVVVPPARPGPWDANPNLVTTPGIASATNPPDPAATRNFENFACDYRGSGMGNGVVLNTTGGAAGRQENVSNPFGRTLFGAYTVWARRKLHVIDTAPNEGRYEDDSNNDTLILTVEGIAPFQAGSANKAVRLIEYVVTRQAAAGGCASGRGGQVGGGPEGSGYGGCAPLTEVGTALGMAGEPAAFAGR